MDDNPVIYGLEDFHARTLVAQAAESEKINFLIGTQSIRSNNQLHLIEFDDDTGVVTKQAFEHAAGEIWCLASAPQSPDLLATVYNKTQNYQTECGAAVWRFPFECSSENRDPGGAAVERLCNLTLNDDEGSRSTVHSLCWAPENDTKMISLADNNLIHWDIQAAGKDAKAINCTRVEGKSTVHLGACRWCPHQQASQVAAGYGSGILSWDLRSMTQPWTIEAAHSPTVRDLDFNPNRQYYLATCGDDCTTKFWDVRNPSSPILTRSDHSHWVWSVRFNSSYDQLVLTCSSDQRVILNSLPSVASQPIGSLSDNEEEEQKANESKSVDDVLKTFEDHEDSVYCTEWSAADFWTFASLSYDGRLVINKVPKSFKYKQFI